MCVCVCMYVCIYIYRSNPRNKDSVGSCGGADCADQSTTPPPVFTPPPHGMVPYGSAEDCAGWSTTPGLGGFGLTRSWSAAPPVFTPLPTVLCQAEVRTAAVAVQTALVGLLLLRYSRPPIWYEHGNDSDFHRAVEPDSLIADFRLVSLFAN